MLKKTEKSLVKQPSGFEPSPLPGTTGWKNLPTGWEWFNRESFFLGLSFGFSIGALIGLLIWMWSA